MPNPYVFPRIESPYVGSIADLMLRKGDIAAQAAQQIGQAQAGAAAASGQAWGQAAQNIGQDVSGTIQTVTDPRRQLAQQQVEENKRALAYSTTATKIAQSLVGPNGEQPTADQAGLMMTRAGIPFTAQKPILDSLESMGQHHKEAIADAGHIAYRIMNTLPDDASDDDRAHAASAGLGAAVAQGLVSPDQAQQVTQALAKGANPKGMALGFMGLSPSNRFKDVLQDETKPVVLAGAARPGGSPATLVTPGGRPIAAGAPAGPERPPQPTEASLAADAATLGTSQETPTAATSKGALDLMRGQKNPPGLQEQLLEAISTGDIKKANTITQTLQAEARAKQDPAAAALAMQLRNLSVEQAKERLAAERAKNAPLDISGSVNTTMSGRQYIDLSEWQTPEDRQKAQRAAVAGGIVPVNKDTAGMLSDLDTARQNQQTMIRLVESKLPKDAAGRLLKGPANTLEKLAQTDPDLGSIGTFRNAAIQSMRAVAGSKGLRINQAEVQLAIENDIPKLSDTLDTARQKLANLSAFMENIERAHLVRDRGGLVGTDAHPAPVTPPITLTPGLIELGKRP